MNQIIIGTYMGEVEGKQIEEVIHTAHDITVNGPMGLSCCL